MQFFEICLLHPILKRNYFLIILKRNLNYEDVLDRAFLSKISMGGKPE